MQSVRYLSNFNNKLNVSTHFRESARYRMSAVLETRYSLFCDVTQHRLVLSYRQSWTAWTLEDGTDMLSRNVGNNLRCVALQKSEDLIHTAAEAWNHGSGDVSRNRQDNGSFFVNFSMQMHQKDDKNVTILSVSTKHNCILITRLYCSVYKRKKKGLSLSLSLSLSVLSRHVAAKDIPIADTETESQLYPSVSLKVLHCVEMHHIFSSPVNSFQVKWLQLYTTSLKLLWTEENYLKTILSLN